MKTHFSLFCILIVSQVSLVSACPGIPEVLNAKTFSVQDLGYGQADHSLCCSAVPERFEICKHRPNRDSEASTQLAEKIWAMDSDLGLGKETVVALCRYIDQTLSHRHLSPSRSVWLEKFRCRVSWEPSLDGYLISDLPRHRIGQGVHKIVKKGLLYSDHPRILAVCSSDFSGKSEVVVLRRFRNKRGIIPLIGATRRSSKKIDIFLEYFSEGGLLDKHQRAGFPFSDLQKQKIAKDVSCGLLEMHRKGLVHRDLHLGNILLKRGGEGLFDAVLVDFGKTRTTSQARKERVLQAAKSKNGPEILTKPVYRLSSRAGEVYALGTNFYHLVWDAEVPWAHAFNPYHLKSVGLEKRRRLARHISSRYRELCQRCLPELSHDTGHGRFKRLILHMIHPNPSKRPSMQQVVNVLEEILPGK